MIETERPVETATDQSTASKDMTLPIEEVAASSRTTSWADMIAQEEEAKQKLIDVENEGIHTGDQESAWARIMDMTDADLRTESAAIDRSGVNTYHFDPTVVNTTPQETSFDQPAPLPAWVVREEFLHKLNACKFLTVKAPTGSGKSTIFPALAAKVMPKERVMCTQVKRNTTVAVCHSTRKMWKRSQQDLVVGFKHGMADKQTKRQGSSSVQRELQGMRNNHWIGIVWWTQPSGTVRFSWWMKPIRTMLTQS